MDTSQKGPVYDATLKSLFGDETSEIIAQLIPGCEVEANDECNIEIDRTTLKADLVYPARYKSQRCILNMEIQAEPDPDLIMRVMQYHMGLHAKHRLPVLSVVLYPFKMNVETPPYDEKCADEIWMTLRYRALRLWEWDARMVVREHIVCLYPLLPAMQHVTISLMRQAVQEMGVYYQHKREQLRRHLSRFYKVLDKSEMLPQKEKKRMAKELDMQYGRDWFLETLPEVIDMRAQSRAEGQLEDAQEMLVTVVCARFETLATVAQARAASSDNAEELRRLVAEIVKAPTEAAVLRLLQTEDEQPEGKKTKGKRSKGQQRNQLN